MRADGGITARGDAVRRPLILVSFSILIPNALASFFFFCARRLFYRGARLRGIASDPLRAGGGITARWDAVRCPIMLVSFSVLIPNTLSLFFFAVLLCPQAIPLGGEPRRDRIGPVPRRGLAVGGRAGGGDHSLGGRGTSSLNIGLFFYFNPQCLCLLSFSSAPAGYSIGGQGSEGSRRILCGPVAGSQPGGTRYVVPSF